MSSSAKMNIKGSLVKVKSFLLECRRVLRITRKPTKEEFKTIVKASAMGMAIIGAIGFLIHILRQIFIPPVVAGTAAMEEAIRRAAPRFRRHRKPLLACFLGQRGVKAKLGSSGRFVPCYPFPEEAVAALARAVRWRSPVLSSAGTCPRRAPSPKRSPISSARRRAPGAGTANAGARPMVWAIV